MVERKVAGRAIENGDNIFYYYWTVLDPCYI